MGVKAKWNGGRIPQLVEDAAERAVELSANQVMGTAVDRTPVETGDLRRSAHVTTDGTTAAVAYSFEYAIYQHEALDWEHTDGQAKFLETAMRDDADTVKSIVQRAVKGAIQ